MLKINFKQLNQKYVVKLLLPLGSVARFLNNSTFKVTLITLQVSTIVILLIAILQLSRFIEQAEHNSFHSAAKDSLIYSQTNYLNDQDTQINTNSTLQYLPEKNSQDGRIFRIANLIVPAVIILQACVCTQTVLKKKQATLQAFILLLIALLDLFLFYQSLGSSFFRSSAQNSFENKKENNVRSRVIYSIMIMGKLISLLITLQRHNKQEVITDQSCADMNLNLEQMKKKSNKVIKKQQVLSNKSTNKLNFIPSSVPNQGKKQTIQKQKNNASETPLLQHKRESVSQSSTQNESVSSPKQNLQSSIGVSSSQESPTFFKSENDTILPFTPQPETKISEQQPEFSHSNQQAVSKTQEGFQLNSSHQIQKSSISDYLIPINPDNQVNNSSYPTSNSPSLLVFPQLIDQPISQIKRPTFPMNLLCQKESSTTANKDIFLGTVGEDTQAKWNQNQITKRNEKVQSSTTEQNNSSNNTSNLEIRLGGTISNSHSCTPSHQTVLDEQDSTNDESNFQSTNSNQELLVSHTPDISHLSLAGDSCRTKREYLDEAQIIKTAYFEMFFQQSFQQQMLSKEEITKNEYNKQYYRNESSESEDEDGDCENDDDEEDEEDIKQQIHRRIDKTKFFLNSRMIQGHIQNNEDICSDTASTQYQELFSIPDEIKSHLDLDLGDDNSLFSNSLRMKAIDVELSLLECEDELKKNKKKQKSTEQKKKRRNKRKQMQKEKKQLLKQAGGDLKLGSKDTPNPKKNCLQSQGDQVQHSSFTNESKNIQMKRLLDDNLLEYFTLNVIISQGISVSVYITDFSQFDYQFDMQSQFYGIDKDSILDSKINFIFEFLSLNLYPTLTPFFEQLLSKYASIKLAQVFERDEQLKNLFTSTA